MNKILILGGTSYIGRHLFNALGSNRAVRTFRSKPVENGIYFNALSSDLSEILKTLENISHAVIFLGDTNPETCAEDTKKSNKLNIESTKLIIDCLNKHKIKPVFASSEFIFDGKKGNYTEKDSPNPILVYGRQKVEIEEYLKKNCSDFIIVRFAKVFGSSLGDKTLFTNWLDDIEKNKDIHCADDQIFSPIYVKDVVDSIISLIEKDCSGIFNISSKTPYSRLELLEMLIKHVKKYSPVKVNIIRHSIHDFPLREKRPLNVSMKSDKLTDATGILLHNVDDVCGEMVKEYFEAHKQ